MDAKDNIHPNAYSLSGCKFQTGTIKVSITTDDYEIEGFVHIKPGSYQSRVSDILNIKELHFIPLTHVTYRSIHNPGEPPRTAETMIVRLDTIKVVVPHENASDTAGAEAGGAAGAAMGGAAGETGGATGGTGGKISGPNKPSGGVPSGWNSM